MVWLHLGKTSLLCPVRHEQCCSSRAVGNEMSPGRLERLALNFSWYKIGANYAVYCLLQCGLFWAYRCCSESFRGDLLWIDSLGAICAQAKWGGYWMLSKTSSSVFGEDLIYNNFLELLSSYWILHSANLNGEAKFTLIPRKCNFLKVRKFRFLLWKLKHAFLHTYSLYIFCHSWLLQSVN